MLIAIVDVWTDPADRPEVLAFFEAEQPQVRAMPGCIDFRVVTPTTDDAAVTIVHEWVDDGSFGGYLQSEVFARSNEVVRPLMSRAPVSRRFQAELAETVA